MNLSIQKMCPELTDAYFDFFDNRAFADNSPYYPCYCNAFQLTKEQLGDLSKECEANGGGQENFRIALRNSAIRMVEQNIIQGYLAFDGDDAIGWCNANDRKNYTRVGEFDPDNVPDDVKEAVSPVSESMAAAQGEDETFGQAENEEKIKSIVCFEIAPEYRGKGIATALLNRVCEDAVQDGYDKIEVYPVVRDTYEKLDFTGPIHMYEKAGFVRVSQHGKELVMQKTL